jgi:predicted TIM-barrel fold metal-dependent hydrolase
MTQMIDAPPEGPSRTTPLVVVSGDSHIGPRLEDMRAYCPADLLDDYDAFTTEFRSGPPRIGLQFAALGDRPEVTRLLEYFRRTNLSAGHHDMHARLRDMDRDGVAAEVIWHQSHNGEPIPFLEGVSIMFNPADDPTRVAAGYGIYNRWLADACSIEPERHVGLAYLPLWDLEAAIRELEWAGGAGLRGVNFPAPLPGLPHYDDPVWEPYWSACEDHGMVLGTHSGAGSIADYTGPHAGNLLELEAGGWPARRGLHRLVFGAVFERHPRLTMVLTEQNGDWWSATRREYDSSYATHRWQIEHVLPEPPSFYLDRNVFIGASFMAPFEARRAVDEGYWHNVVWGRDYPHIEGTWQYQEDRPGEENLSRLSMRFALAGIEAEPTVAMVGENGIRAYGLDRDALTKVAHRIGAPTLDELARPVGQVPVNGGVLAFRTIGPWG